jgi:hypothetical protein
MGTMRLKTPLPRGWGCGLWDIQLLLLLLVFAAYSMRPVGYKRIT